MLQSASGNIPCLGLPSTASHHSSPRPDLEIEGRVPYNRSHHAWRVLSFPSFSRFFFPKFTLHSIPFHRQLRRLVRARDARRLLQTKHTLDVQLEQDVNTTPPSSSPIKSKTKTEHLHKDSLIPLLNLGFPRTGGVHAWLEIHALLMRERRTESCSATIDPSDAIRSSASTPPVPHRA